MSERKTTINRQSSNRHARTQPHTTFLLGAKSEFIIHVSRVDLPHEGTPSTTIR